ncbi:MAG: hypothetical protein LC102_05365 [Ignavibacteriales bacterium]|jgi:hypothetical protein|nr:MAG: hypothetical protein F9K26_06740 [Ignavibacteriaceae bacterium]MBW7873195.1 hypothetical protein [Ignavibacteria bacterium]MCZ2142837.1 hypothetical protein [Ignavibacteriales bacterium]OQY79284.1 MAG: hypothetical protein B6D45_01060 [Ignavibacteriales bacterium UTCHB3]MBV6443931.1 hypothetical protein [Ignavibacteriaceae bacterium]
MKKLLRPLILSLFLCSVAAPQIAKLTDVGGGVGLGVFKGNTSEEFGYSAQGSFDFKLWFSEKYYFRSAAFYTRKFSILLPEDRYGRNYPYLQGFSLKFMGEQLITTHISVEGGGGLAVINDRSFPETDVWSFGSGISFHTIFYFFDKTVETTGYSVHLGVEWNVGFFNTIPEMNTVQAQLHYSF